MLKLRLLLFSVLFGVTIGLAFITFKYAKGFSYLSSDPKACVNCHIMESQYDSWQKGSHHSVASCVECHLPHGFISKYLSKAENGYNHSAAFTLQNFHEPIRLTPKNSRILQENCVACHEKLVGDMAHRSSSRKNDLNCVKCHRDVGHGTRMGLGGRDVFTDTQSRINTEEKLGE